MFGKKRFSFFVAISGLLLVLAVGAAHSADGRRAKGFERWSLAEAIDVLSKSPWARQETFTRVLGGIGSGLEGEKEIYNTFFVRFLSAPPIRQAYARVRQIEMGYDSLSAEEKREADGDLSRILEMDTRDWIVVSVSFRSNNPRQESRVEQFFQGQTVETIKNRAYLSTARHPRVPIYAYFQPREQSVGAKFVFPRRIGGELTVSPIDESVVFELDVPGADPLLRATFTVKDLMIDGELVL